MDINHYINERLNHQISWYSKKSQISKRWFGRLRISELTGAVSIPFLIGTFGKNDPAIIFIIGIPGAVIAALINLHYYRENWSQYLLTCELLTHEKYLFLSESNPYYPKNFDSDIIKRKEFANSSINSKWFSLHCKFIRK